MAMRSARRPGGQREARVGSPFDPRAVVDGGVGPAEHGKRQRDDAGGDAGAAGGHDRPFHLDARAPKVPLSEFTAREGRFAILARTRPEEAARLAALAQHDADERRHVYEQLAQVEHEATEAEPEETP